jgi:hypothetical protein
MNESVPDIPCTDEPKSRGRFTYSILKLRALVKDVNRCARTARNERSIFLPPQHRAVTHYFHVLARIQSPHHVVAIFVVHERYDPISGLAQSPKRAGV